jgi:hypothetical protein
MKDNLKRSVRSKIEKFKIVNPFVGELLNRSFLLSKVYNEFSLFRLLFMIKLFKPSYEHTQVVL